MSYGFVYFAVNASMPDIVKIGTSCKHPRVRLAELSGATGCPQPFELIAFFDHENAARVEAAIHKDLEDFRVNDRREFFDVPLVEVFFQILQFNPEPRVMGVCCTGVLEYMIDQEDYARRSPSELSDMATWMARRAKGEATA